ncbi:u-box domain-containing protein 62 [Quercus suber]|uniref:U-box domain-containing protein 62 n=1 Tax=Quercus suber TaxID=58331 RepID=A0AAW0KVH3_QUESU
MSSEEIGMVPSQSHSNGLNPQLVFEFSSSSAAATAASAPPQHHHQRRVGLQDHPKTTRELSGYIDDKLFFTTPQPPTATDFRRNNSNNNNNSLFAHRRQWDGNGGGATTPSSDEDDDDDDILGKDGNVGQSANDAASENHHQQQQGRLVSYQNAVTIAEPDGELYYSQYLQGTETASASGHKDVVMDNGCGFSGRRDVSCSSESGESLRAILSDPVNGALMDDAMILPCGHSFGGGGIQHVTRMKVCYTCSQSVSEDSIAPNLSLRAAVQAFRREEELQFYRSSKRRRERFDQDKGGYGDSTLMDPPRGRGVQFPFAVTDRGNKRTPQRFVGREAIVTTQCLNGWLDTCPLLNPSICYRLYVVKTLDNAESVKLQYRSLAKVPDDPSSKTMSSKMAPNWL